MKEKGPNVAIRAGLKTAGFPHSGRLSVSSSLADSLSVVNTYLFTN